MTRYETVFDINVDINIVCSKNHISGNLVRIWLQLLVPSSVHRQAKIYIDIPETNSCHIF